MSKKSGAEYRKEKKRREAQSESESEKHAAYWNNWFSEATTASEESSIQTTQMSNQSTDTAREVDSENMLAEPAQLQQQCNIDRIIDQNLTDMITPIKTDANLEFLGNDDVQENQQNKKRAFMLNFQDPAKWPEISNKSTTELVMHGPDNNMECVSLLILLHAKLEKLNFKVLT